MKLVTIVGARPQFVKAAAVRRAIEAYKKTPSTKKVRDVWVHTGQHYDYLMDGVFFEELELPAPDHHLGVGSGSHAKQTALMMERIEVVLQEERPDVVMVYGDTNSTLAGALAAAKMNIPVAHVEAGVRSYNRAMAEETNRLLTDHLSSFLFCPTAQAVKNLLKEGIKDGRKIVVKRVGDVMYDSILYYSALSEARSTILKDLDLVVPSESSNPQSAIRNPQSAIPVSKYYLVTLHRAENTDDPGRLASILAALNEIGKEAPVILPLHPRTRKMMKTFRLDSEKKRVSVIDPLPYLDMVALAKNAGVILTDSGGLQKEAYWLKVPCLTLRNETEWTETVEEGWNVLAGAESDRIVEGVRSWERKRLPKQGRGLFGDGKASEKIVRILMKHFIHHPLPPAGERARGKGMLSKGNHD